MHKHCAVFILKVRNLNVLKLLYANEAKQALISNRPLSTRPDILGGLWQVWL